MKKEIINEIEIPKEISLEVEKDRVNIKGKHGSISRNFDISGINFEKKGDKIILSNKKATKKDKRKMNTIKAHIENMIKGVQEKFEYKLKICSSHFPITVKISGKDVMIKNFLGEKIDRKMKLPEEVDVKVDKDVITISACNKEIAGQTAASFETITKIRNRDRRRFQDGIFMTNKPGREI